MRRESMWLVVGVTAAFVPVLSLVTVSTQTRVSPVPALEQSIAGRDNFEFYCASCHGSDGKGDGPIASALKSRPADLTGLARRNGGRFPRERVRGFVEGTERPLPAHGSTEMPVWGPIFRAFDPLDLRVKQRLDNLVSHIESLQSPTTAPEDTGSRLFRTHCASCHGATAQGNGPLADQLRQRPSDLTQFTRRNGGVFPSARVYRIIDGRDVPSHGDRDMPVWGDVFARSHAEDGVASVKARIDAIVRYLEGIQGRGAD